MKNNICILCHDVKFAKLVAESLSIKFSIMFADTHGIIAYKLADFIKNEEKVGKEYVDNLMSKQILEVSSYENCIYYLSTADLNMLDSLEKLEKNSLIIYLDVYRNKIRHKVSSRVNNAIDINIPLKNLGIKSATTKVYNALMKYN